ncbi:MAG TPA: hypothetical protein VK563_04325 [Puia sp.]|nr:hypothetical protein [Puia sp.]
MEKIAFLALLLLGLASFRSASAQDSGLAPVIPQAKTPKIAGRDSLRLAPLPLLSLRDQRLLQLYHAKEGRSSLDLRSGDSVRVMPPDRMICRVPGQGGLEKMPVRKLQNRRPVDPMPNAMPGVGGKVPSVLEKRAG